MCVSGLVGESNYELDVGNVTDMDRVRLLRSLRDSLVDYSPHVNTTKKFGGMGRIKPLRFNPCVSSSNPAGQVLFRCNWDVQCFDRVPVVSMCASRSVSSNAQSSSMSFVKLQAADIPGGGDVLGVSVSQAVAAPVSVSVAVDGGCPATEPAEPVLEEEPDHVIDDEWGLDAAFVENLVSAIELLFQDAADSARYTTYYITKDNPIVTDVLPEQALGIERLRLQDAEASTIASASGFAVQRDPAIERGRRTVIRLQTSSNRETLKKLPEMCLQRFFGHECYSSHESWTLFCKVLVRLAYTASKDRQSQARGVEFTEGDDVEPEFLGEEEHILKIRIKSTILALLFRPSFRWWDHWTNTLVMMKLQRLVVRRRGTQRLNLRVRHRSSLMLLQNVVSVWIGCIVVTWSPWHPWAYIIIACMCILRLGIP